jgi:transcriptional regulator with GAF, ATPase, and Fis domain
MTKGGTLRIKKGQTVRAVLEVPTFRLRVVDGPDRGTEVALVMPRIRVGTGDENDLVLTDPKVSGQHLEVLQLGERVVLRDLDSTNGTRVRGLRVTEVDLEPGLVAELGDSQVRVEWGVEEHHGLAAGATDRLGDLVGASEPMRALYSTLRAVAPSQATVLLTGETGTGKELVARALHELSGREGPLVTYNCGAASSELMGSDLFGHVKGAFTGAAESREGAFRRAGRGTLFLDEVGDLAPGLQAHLLRALENREVTPVGSDETLRVNVRLVAATNRDLGEMVEAGSFRRDLLHRLSVVPVELPPLRERPGDVDLLVDELLSSHGFAVELSEAARDALRSHSWPGNVRELRNLLERLDATCRGRVAEPGDLRLPSDSAAAPGAAASGGTLEELERARILEAMEKHQGNRSAVARELGLARSTLLRKLRAYGVEGAD